MNRFVVVGWLLVVGACATTSGKAPEGTTLAESMKQELAPLPRQDVQLANGRVGKVEAAGPVKVTALDSGVDVIEVPLGMVEPLYCDVFSKTKSTGSMLESVLRDLTSKGEVKSVKAVTVELVKGEPVTFVESIYLIKPEQGLRGAHAKIAYFESSSAPMMCLLTVPGHSAAFRRVVKGLAEALITSAPASKARYAEVQIIKVKDTPIGFARLFVRAGQTPGIERQVLTFAVFAPVSASALKCSDSAHVAEVDENGEVQSAQFFKFEGKVEPVESVKLRREPGNVFTYERIAEGKTVTGTFTSEGGLTTQHSARTRVRAFLSASQPEALVVPLYLPDTDAVKATSATYRRGAAGNEARIEVGQLRFDDRVDANGIATSSTYSVGKMQVTEERVWFEGTP